MPYEWSSSAPPEQVLTLWPHQSLPPRGFALFIAITVAMISLPLTAVLGTVLLWGLLPFLALAVPGVWYAVHRNRRAAQVLEVLTLTDTNAHLSRQNPEGTVQHWDCNRYWATAELHPKGGPVPHYVTLKGAGREVEIGAFLSEDERVALYEDLSKTLRAS
ncbi:MAG: DUF2244 domain-containing protein [Sedimentitalea sp.]